MAFCNPCVRPANSSIVTYSQRSKKSIKTLLRCQLFKKSSARTSSRPPIHHRSVENHSHTSARFQRIKGSNIVREVNPISEYSFKTDSTNNYDMTMFHDDEIDDTQVELYRRQSKTIPRWSRKSQLQLAVINQIYFNDKNPEDIFGCVHMDLAHETVQSIELRQLELSLVYSRFPPNFV